MLARLAAALLLVASPLLAQVAPPGLDAPTRAAVVDSVARVLEARYVDEPTAHRLAARLRERLAAGAYDAVVEPAAFGAALMRDLQAVAPDKHLRLSYEPERQFMLGGPPAAGAGAVMVAPGGAPPAGAARPWTRIDGRDSATIARTNFGFDGVQRLAGNVGYLKLSQFVPLDYSRATAAAAMAFLAGSDAVVVDLRDNVGGAPELVELLVSYFLPPEPRVLLTTYSRALGAGATRRSLAEVPGRRLAGVPLYVLQNRNSASSAETFAYVVQQQRIGTVVGDTSAGAGNGGAKTSVGAGLALFVPMFRVTSGPGYERTGVAPDVPADADSALAVAHRLALEGLARAGAAPEVRREREWALELLRAEQAPVPVRDLSRYAGTYGTRTVRVARGRLVHVGSTGWATPLVPVAPGVFRADDARFRFITDASGRATALEVETIAGRTSRAERTS